MLVASGVTTMRVATIAARDPTFCTVYFAASLVALFHLRRLHIPQEQHVVRLALSHASLSLHAYEWPRRRCSGEEEIGAGSMARAAKGSVVRQSRLGRQRAHMAARLLSHRADAPGQSRGNVDAAVAHFPVPTRRRPTGEEVESQCGGVTLWPRCGGSVAHVR